VRLFQDLVGVHCKGFDFNPLHDLPPEDCGSQTAFHHPSGYQIMRALIEKGVIGDFREPNIMRFGFGAPYLRYTDIWDAVQSLKTILVTEEWMNARFSTRLDVT